MTTIRTDVETLRDKLADTQRKAKRYLETGEFDKFWYRHGLDVQQATLDYVVKQLNEILEATSEPSIR